MFPAVIRYWSNVQAVDPRSPKSDHFQSAPAQKHGKLGNPSFRNESQDHDLTLGSERESTRLFIVGRGNLIHLNAVSSGVLNILCAKI